MNLPKVDLAHFVLLTQRTQKKHFDEITNQL